MAGRFRITAERRQPLLCTFEDLTRFGPARGEPEGGRGSVQSAASENPSKRCRLPKRKCLPVPRARSQNHCGAVGRRPEQEPQDPHGIRAWRVRPWRSQGKTANGFDGTRRLCCRTRQVTRGRCRPGSETPCCASVVLGALRCQVGQVAARRRTSVRVRGTTRSSATVSISAGLPHFRSKVSIGMECRCSRVAHRCPSVSPLASRQPSTAPRRGATAPASDHGPSRRPTNGPNIVGPWPVMRRGGMRHVGSTETQSVRRYT